MYAIGDVLEGVPELTPVAAKSGLLLARRLAAEKQGLDIDTKDYSIPFDESVPSAGIIL